jgi:hypothetical protein
VKLLGVYPNPEPPVGVAGIPFAASTHENPSAAALVDVQLDPHDTSFFPDTTSHCPLPHCALLVQ